MTEVPIKIRFSKSLNNLLPSRLIVVKPDSASDFQLYITDKSGNPFPLKDEGGVINSIINTDNNLVITGIEDKTINISPALLSVINSALQSGDNISELTNDAGYITSFTETDPIFQASEASLFVAGDKSNLDNQSGINTGDETTSSIQTKRPLKTVNGESLEGSGNVQINYNDLDNLPTIPTVITNHSGLNLDDGTNPHGTTKSDVGLSNVDNTSDANKPISTATQTALNNLVTLNTAQTVTGSKQFNDVPLIKKTNTAIFPTGSGGNFFMGGNGGYDVFDFYSIDGYDQDGFGTVQIYSNPEEGNQINHTSLDNQESSILRLNYGETYLRHIYGGQQTSLYVNGITDKIIIEGTQSKYAALGTSLITDTKNFEFPDKNGTLALSSDIIESAENKLDKATSSGVERAYIINADGSQGTKATSDFKDVLEFANFDAFPTTGETGIIYIALDTNFTYRWTGSVYFPIGGINQDLYPIKYWYQATGVGVLQTYGTNAISASGTQSDVVGVVSYRKYLTTTALGNLAIVRESSFLRINSNRGFHYEMRFKLENTASAPDWRGLFGFRTTSAPTNINPTDDFQPFLGIGADSGDTNLFFISKLVIGIIVKVDTGILKSTTNELLLEIKRLNGTNTNELTLKNLSTGDMVTTVFNNGGITTITNYVSNNTSAQAIGFSIQRIRLNISE